MMACKVSATWDADIAGKKYYTNVTPGSACLSIWWMYFVVCFILYLLFAGIAATVSLRSHVDNHLSLTDV